MGLCCFRSKGVRLHNQLLFHRGHSYFRFLKFITAMPTITDEQMQQMLAQTKEYTLVLLKANPAYTKEVDQKIIWEHGRRNFQLRAEGLLNIVAPTTQEHAIAGICVFNADVAKNNGDHGRRSGGERRHFHLRRLTRAELSRRRPISLNPTSTSSGKPVLEYLSAHRCTLANLFARCV